MTKSAAPTTTGVGANHRHLIAIIWRSLFARGYIVRHGPSLPSQAYLRKPTGFPTDIKGQVTRLAGVERRFRAMSDPDSLSAQ